ncbi:hypothetical protein VUR80DRAFT_4410 [Thermomyces stellatus]
MSSKTYIRGAVSRRERFRRGARQQSLPKMGHGWSPALQVSSRSRSLSLHLYTRHTEQANNQPPMTSLPSQMGHAVAAGAKPFQETHPKTEAGAQRFPDGRRTYSSHAARAGTRPFSKHESMPKNRSGPLREGKKRLNRRVRPLVYGVKNLTPLRNRRGGKTTPSQGFLHSNGPG